MDEVDNDDSPPPNVKKEEKKDEKVKTNTVSLFDADEEDESDWNDPIFTPSKPEASSTLKVCVIYSKNSCIDMLPLLQLKCVFLL